MLTPFCFYSVKNKLKDLQWGKSCYNQEGYILNFNETNFIVTYWSHPLSFTEKFVKIWERRNRSKWRQPMCTTAVCRPVNVNSVYDDRVYDGSVYDKQRQPTKALVIHTSLIHAQFRAYMILGCKHLPIFGVNVNHSSWHWSSWSFSSHCCNILNFGFYAPLRSLCPCLAKLYFLCAIQNVCVWSWLLLRDKLKIIRTCFECQMKQWNRKLKWFACKCLPKCWLFLILSIFLIFLFDRCKQSLEPLYGVDKSPFSIFFHQIFSFSKLLCFHPLVFGS